MMAIGSKGWQLKSRQVQDQSWPAPSLVSTATLSTWPPVVGGLAFWLFHSNKTSQRLLKCPWLLLYCLAFYKSGL
jgi:hypothetical protein